MFRQMELMNNFVPRGSIDCLGCVIWCLLSENVLEVAMPFIV